MSTQNGKLWCRQSDIISAYATRSEGKLALTNLPDCLDQRIIGVGCDFVFIMTFVIDVSGYISILKELDYCRKNLEPTLRKEPVGMLDDGLYDGHHVHRGSCSHLSQTPACINVDEQQLDAFEHNDGQSEISSNNSYPIEIHSTIQDWGLGSCHQIITIPLLLYTNWKVHFHIQHQTKILYIDQDALNPFSPLSLGPEQVGSQDDGNVAGSHFVHLAVLSQFG